MKNILDKKIAVVLHNQKTLSEICGANDKNLRTIEELIGAPVYSRGNELFLESEEKDKQSIFSKIIQQLKDHTDSGQHPSPELISSIYSSLIKNESQKADLLKQIQIHIPQSNQSIFPKGYNQARYMKQLRDLDMVFCVGPAGTGKTYIAVAQALYEVLNREKRKLILTRPVVEAGENLGFLPGDFTQKISPYLKPLYDAMETFLPNDFLTRLEENRAIEIAPLAYMRGRSLNNSVIILDEAQNTTKEQMKMFLTRIGDNSKAFITGDITQIDLPARRVSGLVHASRILSNIEEIGVMYMDSQDVVRNPLVRKIVHAYEQNKE